VSGGERFGTRDLTFSKWHRPERHGGVLPEWCSAIDIDFCEYCAFCKKPLALIELARDVGQPSKPTTVLENLSRLSGVPAYCILYTGQDPDVIVAARIRRVQPNPTAFEHVDEDELKARITRFHTRCDCIGAQRKFGRAAA
jgi:hypothetical protein